MHCFLHALKDGRRINLWEDLQEIRSDRVSRTEMRIHTSEIPQTLQSCKNHTRKRSMEEMVARWLMVSTVVSDNIKRHHLMEGKGNSPRRPRSREVAGRDTTVQVCWDGHMECPSTLQGYVCPDQVLGLFCPCSLPSCCPFETPSCLIVPCLKSTDGY